jgi:predicted ATP-grasp superfamily ATP-dependent carboligase
MGWIAACVLLVVLLPLLGMLYVDVLQTKHEAKQQVEKVEKLRRQVEQQQKKGNKDE